MVCSECGIHNLSDARFCVRCGSRVVPLDQPEQPAPPPPPPSPAEEQALVARELLANSRVGEARATAKAAVTLEPETVLPHVVLGEVHEHTGALDDALWEYRRAVELNPDLSEAREKAEAVRRQIVHPHASTPVTPIEAIRTSLSRIPRRLVPVIAGVAAGLLVFTVGAAEIVVNTSPQFLTKRAFEQQMALGRKCYREGRYREAAEAFRQAQQLNPSSLEAMNRLNDAEKMAGPVQAPPGPGHPPMDETQMFAATESATPGRSAFPPVWIGPTPGGATVVPTASAPPTAPPPYIPVPKPTNTPRRPDLPPLPPPAPKTTQPFEGFEGPSRNEPGAESPSAPSGSQPPGPNAEGIQPKPPPGWTIWVNPPRRPVSAKAVQPQTLSPSAADGARREADRLRKAGRAGEAARRYAEAEALYRSEADRGGPGRAANAAAADVCRDARKLCESQAQ